MKITNNYKNNTTFAGVKHYCSLGPYSYSTSIVEKAIDNSKILQKYICNNDVNITLRSENGLHQDYKLMELIIQKIFSVPPKPTRLIDKIKYWLNNYDITREEEIIKIKAISINGSSISLQRDLAERISKIETDSDLVRYTTHRYIQ